MIVWKRKKGCPQGHPFFCRPELIYDEKIFVFRFVFRFLFLYLHIIITQHYNNYKQETMKKKNLYD